MGEIEQEVFVKVGLCAIIPPLVPLNSKQENDRGPEIFTQTASRQSEETASCGADIFVFFVAVIKFAVVGPDGAWPGGIVRRAANDVNVHLPDLVADAGDIEFFRRKVAGDKFADLSHRAHDLEVLVGLELVQILNAVDLGDKQQPREQRVVFQEQAATAKPPDFEAACREAWMEFKCHATKEAEFRQDVTASRWKLVRCGRIGKNVRCQRGVAV